MKITKQRQYRLTHKEIKNIIDNVEYEIKPNGFFGYLCYPIVMIYVHIKLIGLYIKCSRIRVEIDYIGVGDKE